MRRGPILIAFSFLALLAGCAVGGKGDPTVRDGVIDLRSWDFDAKPWLELNGSWKFAWKELIPPADALSDPVGTRMVPLAWQTDNLPGKPSSHLGWATYGVRILLPDKVPSLGLKLTWISSAFDLYLDGQRIFSCGKVGTSKADSSPAWTSRVIELPAHGAEMRLVFHISDFYERTGGMSNPVYFGSLMPLVGYRQSRLLYEIFIFGVLLVMGLYHLALFLFYRGDRSNLFFALLCFLLCWRDFIYEELFVLQVLPNLDWFFMLRLGYWDYVLCTLVFYQFIRSQFAPAGWKPFTWFINLAAAAYCAVVAFTGPDFFADYLNLYHIVTLGIGAFTVTVLARSIARKDHDALLFLLGFLLLFAAVVNDILRTAIYLQTVLVAPLGLFAFLFFQSIVMTRRYSLSIKSQARMAELEKLKTLGVLAAGVAHEINTANNAIIRNLPIASEIWRELEPTIGRLVSEYGNFKVRGWTIEELDQEMPLLLSDTFDAGQQIRRIVEDLKDYARDTSHNPPEDVDLGRVVAYAARLLAPLREKRTRDFGLEIEPGLPPVRANFQKLTQVAVNLLENALLALPDPSAMVRLRVKSAEGGSAVVLECADGGVGIEPDVAARIFEPFFTTRREQGGMGLGMSVVQGIIREFKGEIGIQSAPGQGTTVTVSFPASPS